MGTATTTIAAYGAILSTIALGWNILRGRSDRGVLKVAARFMVRPEAPIHVLGGPPTREGEFLVVTVTNIGGRPLVLGKVGFERKTSDEEGWDAALFNDRELPKTLQEGDKHVGIGPKRAEVPIHELKSICAKDTTGKTWRLRKRELKRLASAANKERQKGRR